MKKLIFSLMASVLVVSVAVKVSAQTVTRDVSGYNGIACGGPFHVFIKIDGTEGVKLDVDANIVDDIKTEVENGILKVEFKNHWKSHGNIQRADIYISAKTVAYLANSGSGNTTVDGVMTAENAKIALSGSGNIKTAVKSGTLDIKISGSGSIDVKGSTGLAECRISGSGQINGKSLSTETVEASIAGSGDINIMASKKVSARISGSGSVLYSGSASIGETRYAGSGRISKAD
ncbi:putative autotransporter adhesin-like protein [Mucilaginibacter oryzae]|uniref:Putative autotransporter adhesin-like protein n=1 Tax=Mucilaginibacter oryzae TaxID=468058 RepID=A0A316HCP4_9SPHI|nr:head GIN domain-containing protein [Mucilaginibacter oryzae]PWK78296.1 putative autotransporter adhesin-like protein [Mucilaginibacter oryzae]